MAMAGAAVKRPVAKLQPTAEVGEVYRDMLTLVERLHRRILDVVRDELDRRGRLDLNPVQALLLYNIADHEFTPTELRSRGYYLGSNVSHNLKKLNDEGFLDHHRSERDRRSVRIRLTEKGRDMRDILAQTFERHLATIVDEDRIGSDDLSKMNRALLRLERFWTDQIAYRL